MSFFGLCVTSIVLLSADIDGFVRCFDERTGHLHWKQDCKAAVIATPLVVGDSRLFAIRFKLWENEVLTHDDQTYWTSAIQQVPNNPIFQRLCISDDDRAAQAAAEQDAIAGFEALFGDADSFKINQDGSFSATFDLTKD